ncbi:MAG: helix-hairpin-helix domain-containing protein [Desulfobulbaceae bacterium]|nr:helix-hairpin-helix domain-containing protein [Desulfobulbaceae bacterium]
MKKIYLALFLALFLATAAFAEININKATVEDFVTLSGIGPVKAEAIVQYRKEHGDFKNIEGIKEVTGIGDKTFENIKKELTVDTKEKTTVKKK